MIIVVFLDGISLEKPKKIFFGHLDLTEKIYLSPNCYVAGWGTTTEPPLWVTDPLPIDQLALQLHSVNVDIFSRNCLDFDK